MEIWKDIEGYEGRYQVSNLGNVKSLEREINCNGGIRKLKEKLLKGSIMSKGYLYVILTKSSNCKFFLVHRLVANAFIPKIQDHNKRVVDHIDNDKLNNKLDNLQRITNRKNCSKDSKSSLPIGVNLSGSNKNPYKANLWYNSKMVHIGMYKTITKAVNAYEINRQRVEYENLHPIKIKFNN